MCYFLKLFIVSTPSPINNNRLFTCTITKLPSIPIKPQPLDLPHRELINKLILLQHKHHSPSLLPQPPHCRKNRYLHILLLHCPLILLKIIECNSNIKQRNKCPCSPHTSWAMCDNLLILLCCLYRDIKKIIKVLVVLFLRGGIVNPVFPLSYSR